MVSPSVCWSIGPSVCNAFVKIAENVVTQDEDASYVVCTPLFVKERFSQLSQNEVLKNGYVLISTERDLSNETIRSFLSVFVQIQEAIIYDFAPS